MSIPGQRQQSKENSVTCVRVVPKALRSPVLAGAIKLGGYPDPLVWFDRLTMASNVEPARSPVGLRLPLGCVSPRGPI